MDEPLAMDLQEKQPETDNIRTIRNIIENTFIPCYGRCKNYRFKIRTVTAVI